MNDEELLNIGAFASATGLTIPALRHYDEIGLLEPEQVDAGTGYRRYGRRQLDDARLVCGLRAVGVPIDEVRAVLGRPADQVRAVLDSHRERLAAQARELSQRIAAVEEFIERGTPMPAVQAVRPVQIRIAVADVPAAATFYTSAFDLVFNEAISSLQFGTYRSDRFFLITLEERDGRAPVRFGLLVADVDAAHERALDAGADQVHPPTDFAWKPRTSCVRDPDGNLIDLSHS
ncbi:MerR family transcriptional regulator [Actinoplanes sp. NPDC026619]|uniref:MerR family transcriptional regulator n=1 Tax=Actinoplanes sp. NPDC026619 TaxID=3155798 RepID=UPI0033CE34C7